MHSYRSHHMHGGIATAFTLALFIGMFIFNIPPSVVLSNENLEHDYHLAGHIPHGVISIDGDVNLSDTADLEGWTGDGTLGNPYIIENYDIDGGNSHYQCILVNNTRAHFLIRNCTIYDSLMVGIHFDNVSNGKLADNICHHSAGIGIFLENSSINIFENNTCNNNVAGIWLTNSPENHLFKNTCKENSFLGLYLDDSYDNIIANTTLIDDSIFIDASAKSKARQNIVGNNTVDGFPIVYMQDKVGESILGDSGQVILVNCSDVNVRDVDSQYLEPAIEALFCNNITLSNISLYYGEVGVYLANSANCSISNSTFNAIDNTMHLYESHFAIIANNTCLEGYYCLTLDECLNATIYNNTIKYFNVVGVDIVGNYTVIRNNTITENQYGIKLTNSSGSTILDNICSSNSVDCIHLNESDSNNIINNTCVAGILNPDSGIHLWRSNLNTIANNTCMGNYWGIRVHDSDWNVVSDNNCSSNDVGIYLNSALHNRIERNNCTGNPYQGIEVYNWAHWNNITDNLCSFCERAGIFVTYNSKYNRLVNNTCNNCTMVDTFSGLGSGIWLDSGIYDTLLFNNTCIGNINGISIISNCHGNEIVNNSIHQNEYGIFLSSALSGTIENNTVSENEYGLAAIGSSNGNYIYWNYFIDNTNNTHDNATENTIRNNYWSDYTGSDVNGDGIGDVPHPIFGTVGNEDPYPLMSPSTQKLLSEWEVPPSNLHVEFPYSCRHDLNVTGAEVPDWTIDDITHFSIDSDGIIANITTLNKQWYPVEVTATNIYGFTLTASFYIIVGDSIPPTWIDVPEDQQIELGDEFRFDFNATDISGISRYDVNSTYVYIDYSTGVFHGSPSLGVHWYNVTVRDSAFNYAWWVFKITVIDTRPPTINHPIDIECVQYQGGGQEIWWYWNDTGSLGGYEIYKNGILFDSEILDPGNFNHYVQFQIDDENPGIHNYTIVVWDISGNNVTDTVIVTVTAEPPEPTTTETTWTTTTTTTTTTPRGLDPMVIIIIGGLGAVVVVMVIIIVILKKRS